MSSWQTLWTLMLSMLGTQISRQQFKIFFVFFPENQFWHFIHIDISYILSSEKSICMKCQHWFSGKNKKKKNHQLVCSKCSERETWRSRQTIIIWAISHEKRPQYRWESRRTSSTWESVHLNLIIHCLPHLNYSEHSLQRQLSFPKTLPFK